MSSIYPSTYLKSASNCIHSGQFWVFEYNVGWSVSLLQKWHFLWNTLYHDKKVCRRQFLFWVIATESVSCFNIKKKAEERQGSRNQLRMSKRREKIDSVSIFFFSFQEMWDGNVFWFYFYPFWTALELTFLILASPSVSNLGLKESWINSCFGTHAPLLQTKLKKWRKNLFYL